MPPKKDILKFIVKQNKKKHISYTVHASANFILKNRLTGLVGFKNEKNKDLKPVIIFPYEINPSNFHQGTNRVFFKNKKITVAFPKSAFVLYVLGKEVRYFEIKNNVAHIGTLIPIAAIFNKGQMYRYAHNIKKPMGRRYNKVIFISTFEVINLFDKTRELWGKLYINGERGYILNGSKCYNAVLNPINPKGLKLFYRFPYGKKPVYLYDKGIEELTQKNKQALKLITKHSKPEESIHTKIKSSIPLLFVLNWAKKKIGGKLQEENGDIIIHSNNTKDTKKFFFVKPNGQLSHHQREFTDSKTIHLSLIHI